MKTVLGIETATETASAGLYAADGRYREITRPCHRALARDLMGMVHGVLSRTGNGMADIGAVAVSIGPGSFTGLRIGLSTAKGLAAAAGIPVVPVATPAMLARQVPPAGVPLYVLQRARKTEAYVTRFENRENVWVCAEATTVLGTDALRALCDGTPLLTGNACGIPAAPGRFVPTASSGSMVARIGLEILESGTFTPNDELEPEYVKPPDAKKAAPL